MSWTRFGGSTKDAERFWVDLTPVVGEEYKLAFVPPTLAIVWDAYLDAQQAPVEGIPYNLLGILNVLSRCVVDAVPPLDVAPSDLFLSLATSPEGTRVLSHIFAEWSTRVPELFQFQQTVAEGKDGGSPGT